MAIDLVMKPFDINPIYQVVPTQAVFFYKRQTIQNILRIRLDRVISDIFGLLLLNADLS
jgi:hypothetical protein